MPQVEVLRRHRVYLEDFTPLGLGHTLGALGHYDNVHADDMLLEHRHPDLMEICYLAKGRQVFRVTDKDYALRAGDLFVTFPGEQHSTGGKPMEKGELFWMQLYLPKSARFLNLDHGDAEVLVEGLRRLPLRHFSAEEAVGRLFSRLFVLVVEAMEGRSGDGLENIEICSVASQLLLAVVRSAAAGQGRRRDDANLNQAIEFVLAHLDEPLSVEDVAGELGLSTSWFKAKFRRAMGIPPGEYILRAKVERAGEMLRAGARVTDVAYRLGFSSSQYFATVFKRFTRGSPGRLRSGATLRERSGLEPRHANRRHVRPL